MTIEYLNARRDAKEREKPTTAFDWRAHLKVHPAAEVFPLMREIDVKGFEALVADIRAHGLREKIRLWNFDGGSVPDGRNRLDALAEIGALGRRGRT